MIYDTITTLLKALGGPTTRSIYKKTLEGVSVIVKRFWNEDKPRMKLGRGSQDRVTSKVETGGRTERWSGPLSPCAGTERPAREDRIVVGQQEVWSGPLQAGAKVKRLLRSW